MESQGQTAGCWAQGWQCDTVQYGTYVPLLASVCVWVWVCGCGCVGVGVGVGVCVCVRACVHVFMYVRTVHNCTIMRGRFL